MASNYAGSSGTFTDTLTLMTGGDKPTAALFRTPLEKLLDNDVDLQSRMVGAAKFWARVSVSSGIPALLETYNVTGITDNGVGDLTVTIATDFASGSWCGIVSARATAPRISNFSAQAAGSCQVKCTDVSAVATDPDAWNIVGYGAQ